MALPEQLTTQDLWEQMQAYNSGISSQLNTLQNILSSGQIIKPGDDGLTRVAGGVNRYGEIRPDTVLMRDEEGNLAERFRMGLLPEYQALQQKALTEGDTRAAELARQQQGVMTQQAFDDLQKQGSTALAGGMRNLAMRGGASTGSQERLNRDVLRGVMSGNQGINRENRLANLAISQQDEAMKNQLLGQVGGVNQAIQEANINRLQQDIQAQNLAAHNIYSEDMQALAAQKSADAQAAAACFTGDTEIVMEDGTLKRIEDIEYGDVLLDGGKVTVVMQTRSSDVFRYDHDVLVSGSHAVKEDGEWIRVRKSKKADKVDGNFKVYNLGCENHILKTVKNTYSDFFETDDYEELTIDESLEKLNGRLD